MKKITLFFGAAVIIGIGSAFTTVQKDPSGIYVKIGTEFIPLENVEDDGACVSRLEEHCKYTQPNPGDYQPVSGDLNMAWE